MWGTRRSWGYRAQPFVCRRAADLIAFMINDLWYKNAVIYCLSIATYLDSDGDGIGDFPGLMSRLDYLQGMGITAIWLMPFQPSPAGMMATMSQTTTG